VLGLALGVTPVARAQLEPVGVPQGMVRLEVGGSLENYNRRFFQNGTQDYAGDFVRDSAGSNLWPELTSADTTVAAIIGQPTYRIDLGRTTATTQVNVGTVNLGAALGISHFLTLFGNVPIVRVRVQPRFALDSTSGDVGFNPADPTFGSGGAATTAFFNQFDVALATLQTNINNGVYDGNPTQKALAQATLADGTALRTHLDNLLLNPSTASPFVPTGGSAAGLAMTNVVTSLQTVLSGSLGVGGFTQPLDLPAQRLAQQDIDNFIGNPGGPVAGLIQDMFEFKLGDIQLGAVLTPIDRWDRPNHRGGARLALTGAITLPTGTTDFSNNFVDLGTGTGYYRLGLGATADLGKGRVGMRLTGYYDRWMQRFRVKRVSAPTFPMPYAYRLANLNIDPGDQTTLGVRPFFRLASTFALHVGLDYWHRGADRVVYQTVADSVPGVAASELAVESSASSTMVSGGVTFSSGLTRKVPIEARWTYEAVLGASGGRVPQARNMRAELRLYWTLWGKKGK
jgi:hypothetical protein